MYNNARENLSSPTFANIRGAIFCPSTFAKISGVISCHTFAKARGGPTVSFINVRGAISCPSTFAKARGSPTVSFVNVSGAISGPSTFAKARGVHPVLPELMSKGLYDVLVHWLRPERSSPCTTFSKVSHSNQVTSSNQADTLICHTIMRRHSINFPYNLGHLIL